MSNIRSVFVEKKLGFNVEAQSLLRDFKDNLDLGNLKNVRVINKYVISEVSEENYKKALNTIFAELTVDTVYEEKLLINDTEVAFGVEFLRGQYDQRADSASECLALLSGKDKIEIKSAKIIVLEGNLSKEDIRRIKKYYINPVDSREVEIDNKDLSSNTNLPNDVEILDGFTKGTQCTICTFVDKDQSTCQVDTDIKFSLKTMILIPIIKREYEGILMKFFRDIEAKIKESEKA